MQNFDAWLLNKQTSCWWFEIHLTLWCPCNNTGVLLICTYQLMSTWWLQMSWCHINGLVQDCSISSAVAMEILQSCTKPSIWAPSNQQPLCWWECHVSHITQHICHITAIKQIMLKIVLGVDSPLVTLSLAGSPSYSKNTSCAFGT